MPIDRIFRTRQRIGAMWIEAVRRALDRPVRDAAGTLRALLLEDAPRAVAEASAP